MSFGILVSWEFREEVLLVLGFQGPMGPSTLAPAGSYIDTPKLIEIKGFKCIKPFNFIINIIDIKIY